MVNAVGDRTCRLVTLGCKVNQYDTQLVREALLRAGYREASRDEPADLCVVNTCTVTHQADAEGRQLIRRLVRQNPGAQIVVTGCYAARDPDTLRGMPGVIAVVDRPGTVGEVLRQFGVQRMPRGIAKFEGHHRAFVKVQDGCILKCTFCIIPQVRPSLRSRPAEDIETEVRGLVEAGFREVVLTGIHLGHYGLDLSRGKPREAWCRLSQLIRRLARIPGPWRLRLSSLEAAELNEELIDVLAEEPRVCPHLHLSMQSGSDAVLKAMRRRYRIAGFMRRVEQIRRRLDQPAFSTDVIVGFPGETEEQFQQTLGACSEVGFSKIHIFPFSPRQGTPAAQMANQIRSEVIGDRKARLAALATELAERYYRLLVGRELQVLVERVGEGESDLARGTACRYVPARLAAGREDAGELIDVRVTEAAATHVVGQRVAARPAWPFQRNLPVLNTSPMGFSPHPCPSPLPWERGWGEGAVPS